MTVDLYNRQLHPDERQWTKDNAGKFAQFYQDQTGQTLTADRAQQMLLASGYRLVDAAAGSAPGGSKYATAVHQPDIALNNARTFTNRKTEQAHNSRTIGGKSADRAFGAPQCNGLISLTTAGNVEPTSANMSAGSLTLKKGIIGYL